MRVFRYSHDLQYVIRRYLQIFKARAEKKNDHILIFREIFRDYASVIT